MEWDMVGIGIAAAIALIGGNAWVMKLVIDNAVLKAFKEIGKDYVSKEDFERHIEQCQIRGINK